MSESAHKSFLEAQERAEHLQDGGGKWVALAAAIIAVLAALGTLFSHHRSISALTAKNQAILTQSRAADAYNRFESKSIRANLYQAFVRAGVARDPSVQKLLEDTARSEEETAKVYQARGKALENLSDGHDERSELILRSYEMLEYATTFFEVAIVLVSISAIVRGRVLFYAALGLSAIGLVLFCIGFFQAH